jgi:U-box domain
MTKELDSSSTTFCTCSSSGEEVEGSDGLEIVTMTTSRSSSDRGEAKDRGCDDEEVFAKDDTRSSSSVEDVELGKGGPCRTTATTATTTTVTTTSRPRVIVTCPLTQQPLVDPVVNRDDGVSYERSAVVSEDEKDLYYFNRALKDYLSASAASTDVMEFFTCPITHDLMRDPVIDREGNTYERSAVLECIEKNGVSPITRKPLSVEELYDNTTLFWVLLQEIQLREDQDKAEQHDKDKDNNKNDDEQDIKDWKEVLSISRDMSSSLVGPTNSPIHQAGTSSNSPVPPLRDDVNHLVRREQRRSRRILRLMERRQRDQEQRKRQLRQKVFLWSSIMLVILVVVGVLYLFFQGEWTALWVLVFIMVSIGFLVSAPCCTDHTYSGILGGALNRASRLPR